MVKSVMNYSSAMFSDPYFHAGGDDFFGYFLSFLSFQESSSHFLILSLVFFSSPDRQMLGK